MACIHFTECLVWAVCLTYGDSLACFGNILNDKSTFAHFALVFSNIFAKLSATVDFCDFFPKKREEPTFRFKPTCLRLVGSVRRGF
jgi:hypothetical protein